MDPREEEEGLKPQLIVVLEGGGPDSGVIVIVLYSPSPSVHC